MAGVIRLTFTHARRLVKITPALRRTSVRINTAKRGQSKDENDVTLEADQHNEDYLWLRPGMLAGRYYIAGCLVLC